MSQSVCVSSGALTWPLTPSPLLLREESLDGKGSEQRKNTRLNAASRAARTYPSGQSET